MSDSQYKPPYLAGDYVTPAESSTVRLVRELRECGVNVELIPAILETIEGSAEELAADVFSRRAKRCSGIGMALLLRIFLGNREPLREMAQRFGVSHVLLFKREKKLRALLFG